MDNQGNKTQEEAPTTPRNQSIPKRQPPSVKKKRLRKMKERQQQQHDVDPKVARQLVFK